MVLLDPSCMMQQGIDEDDRRPREGERFGLKRIKVRLLKERGERGEE